MFPNKPWWLEIIEIILKRTENYDAAAGNRQKQRKGGEHDRTEHYDRRRRYHDLVVKQLFNDLDTKLEQKGEKIMVITITWTGAAILGGLIIKGIKELSDDK